jgi:hypothetical protein
MNTLNFSLQPLNNAKPSEELDILIPKFDPGPFPPPARICEPLWPEPVDKSWIPFYANESLIRYSLIEDEAEFRRRHLEDWYERCWFVLGKVMRDPAGNVWGSIRRFVAAQYLYASCSYFEFNPETWRALHSKLEITKEMLLGWVHTHSLEMLRRLGRKAASEFPSQQSTSETQDSPESTDGEILLKISSGLFLSQMDIDSAMKLGFNAAYQLTCILDSDTCAAAEDNSKLCDMFGVWGYVDTILKRRSIHIIRDRQ